MSKDKVNDINDYTYYRLIIDDKLFDTYYRNQLAIPLSDIINKYILVDLHNYSYKEVKTDYLDWQTYSEYSVADQVNVINERIEDYYHNLINSAILVGVAKVQYYSGGRLNHSNPQAKLSELI